MCKNLHILKSLRKVLVFWGSLIGNLCYERLHSSCILQGEGETIFFKGAKFFHIPPTSYRFFDILFSWPKEMKKKMLIVMIMIMMMMIKRQSVTLLIKAGEK